MSLNSLCAIRRAKWESHLATAGASWGHAKSGRLTNRGKLELLSRGAKVLMRKLALSSKQKLVVWGQTRANKGRRSVVGRLRADDFRLEKWPRSTDQNRDHRWWVSPGPTPLSHSRHCFLLELQMLYSNILFFEIRMTKSTRAFEDYFQSDISASVAHGISLFMSPCSPWGRAHTTASLLRERWIIH